MLKEIKHKAKYTRKTFLRDLGYNDSIFNIGVLWIFAIITLIAMISPLFHKGRTNDSSLSRAEVRSAKLVENRCVLTVTNSENVLALLMFDDKTDSYRVCASLERGDIVDASDQAALRPVS